VKRRVSSEVATKPRFGNNLFYLNSAQWLRTDFLSTHVRSVRHFGHRRWQQGSGGQQTAAADAELGFEYATSRVVTYIK